MKEDRISGPKRVILLTDGCDQFPTFYNIDISIFAPYVLHLKKKIVAGQVDDYYYRKSVDRDALLDEQGWLHLHIAPDIDNDVLLIAEQSADAVIFIGLVRHAIFQERPRGRSVKRALGRRLHEARLKLSRETRGGATSIGRPKPTDPEGTD